MRLSDQQRRVLAAIQLDAAAPLSQIANRAKLRVHAARYIIHSLEREGVIQLRPMTDVHIIGLTQYSIFFTPYFASRASQNHLMRHLIESPITSDIFELGGQYRYGVVLSVRDIQEVYVFLEQLVRIPGVSVTQKSLSTRVSTSLFQRGYLTRKSGELGRHITYRRSDKRIELDQTDHLLLTAMHQYPKASLRELEPIVGLTHTAIANRIRAFERSGVIIGYVYGISSQIFGMEAYRIIVHTSGFDYNDWERLFKFSMRHPNILCLFQCIGSWDYEFEIEVEDRQQVATICQEIHEFLGASVISITALPIFSFPKSTGYPYSKKRVEAGREIYIQ
jgi:DNA-binding Lrp family transcriptional regulator